MRLATATVTPDQILGMVESLAAINSQQAALTL